MGAFSAYILRLCCCAMIAGMVTAIGGTGPGSKTRSMICGLFVIFSALSPLMQLELGDLQEIPGEFYQEGKDISASAKEEAQKAIREGIIERVRTYILDEAEGCGASVRVTRISLEPDTLVPTSVTLSGQVAPYQRTLLSDHICDTLGIGKEGIEWRE